MQDLFPPAPERTSASLSGVLDSLVHDIARIDPDSRHFHAVNPLQTELDRTMAMIRRLDPRPWAADVRQTGRVKPADPSAEETSEADLLFGVPTEVELKELRRYSAPSLFVDDRGRTADGSDLSVIEKEDHLLVQAGQQLYRTGPNGRMENVSAPTGPRPFHLVSIGPSEHQFLRAPGTRGREIASQIEGLDVVFAGRGKVEIEVTFTGVVPVEDGSDLSQLGHMTEPLKLYGPDAEERSYSITDEVITIPGADSGVAHTLYYEGLYEKTYYGRKSVRIDEIAEHTMPLAPIAERLNDVPTDENVSAYQSSEVIARLPLQAEPVDVTADGHVGGTHAGHPIKHLVPGPYHALVLGENAFSFVEPESVRKVSFEAPGNPRGVTWTQEGLLGVIAEEDSDFVVYGINEIRRGQTGGFAARGPMDEA